MALQLLGSPARVEVYPFVYASSKWNRTMNPCVFRVLVPTLCLLEVLLGHQKVSRNDAHNRAYSLFSALCIDAICFFTVLGDMGLGSSGSANTSESVVLARASLI